MGFLPVVVLILRLTSRGRAALVADAQGIGSGADVAIS
jgi:hypothetical protein